jgi:pyruvate dehydrogenase E2 component (dihydrolipoamide acetyltransferase)
MIRDLLLPQLAMGMSEGTIVEWAVAEGDKVQRDQTLVSIETEKVVTDLPAPYNGYVHLTAKVGDVLPVETPMGKIADTEEEYRSLLAGATVAPAAGTAAQVPELASAAPTTYRNLERPSGRIRASGLAKAIARQKDIDLASLVGTGPGGRIVRRDVIAAPASCSSSAPMALRSAIGAAGGMREKARVPLTGMRKVIADRMVTAKTTAAHTYAFFEIDITKLQAARQTMLAREKELGGRVSMLALQVRAVALACRHVPICNATVGDKEITVWDNVNVGIAVSLPGKGEFDSGLVVPVVRNVETKGILEIDREIKELVSRARNGTLTPADMAEGTITLSSTGGFASGVWSVSTPLLNLPQVVNFQPGSPLDKPVVVDGQVVVRNILPCGLSFDHRAVDGAPIGRFVQKMIDLLAHPELMLL